MHYIQTSQNMKTQDHIAMEEGLVAVFNYKMQVILTLFIFVLRNLLSSKSNLFWEAVVTKPLLVF